MAKERRLPLPGMSSVSIGSEYSDDESEMLRAVERWRAKNRRIPTTTELLRIAKGLGYRKVAAAA